MARIHAKESAYQDTKQMNLLLAILFYGISISMWLWWGYNVTSHIMIPMKTGAFCIIAFVVTGYIGNIFWQSYRKIILWR